MERKFYTDNFEQLLKEKSDEFRMYPSKRVWHSIYNDLHPARKWPSLAISMLLIIALFFAGYWNNTNNSSSASTLADAFLPGKNVDYTNNLNAPIISENLNNKSNLSLNKDYKEVAQPNNLIKEKATDKIGNSSTNASTSYSITKVKPVLKNNLQKNKANTIAEKTTIEQFVQEDNATDLSTLTKLATDQNIIISDNNDNIIESGKINNEIKSNTDIVPGKIADNNINVIENKSADIKLDEKQSNKLVNAKLNSSIKPISKEDKAWMDDYVFYNKPIRKKWKDKTAFEFYITPGISYRKNSSNTKYETSASNSFAATPYINGISNNDANQKPALGLEAGAGIVYSIAKNIRLKAGIQGNYTNYIIHADETNHPILTTVLLNDLNTGNTYLESRASSLSNSSGLQSVKVHNKTYQISLPVGFAYKLTGNNKIEWYAGATIQPTYVFGGKANLLSLDKRNYISDASLIRSWNLNTGFETYIHYKFAGYTLQAGPQFRYQIASTYSQKFTINENLYNTGIKIGLLKNF